MSAEKLYGMIVHVDEGVISWQKFKTEAEAEAYAMGANDMREAIDTEDDCTIGVVHDREPEDEP